MTEPTDKELEAFAVEEQFLLFCDVDEFTQIARAVLAKWGTPPAVAGEPVGEVESSLRFTGGFHVRLYRDAHIPEPGTKLYTHPSPPEGMAVTDAMIDAGKKMLYNSNGRGAPEALRPIQRFNNVVGLMNPEARGLYVRYEDHVAALIEAQQPAPSAACPVDNNNFDHQTAADVLNGKTVSDEAMRKFVAVARWAHDDRVGLRATLLSVRGELASREAEIALLKKALMDAEAPQPTPTAQPAPAATPQADSQPAPEYVGNGMFKGETIEKAAEHWANWCDVRCMMGLSEFLRVVAARAPADSVTAPARPSKSLPYEPTSAMLIAARERDPALPIETVRAIYWSMWRTAPTPPAQAADSVLEDAARYRWLARKVSAHGICDGWQFGFPTALTLPANALAMTDPETALGQCIDAARKQGGA